MNKKKLVFALLVAQVSLLGGCALFIEGNYVVDRGDFRKSIRAVDATVEVKPQARARSISTVDGAITLGRWAQAGALSTVDGRIEMDQGSVCHGPINNVAGSIRLRGARVAGNVRTVTGGVDTDNTLVEGDVEAISGRLQLLGLTHVKGGIVISSPDPKSNDPEQARPPTIVIGPQVVVEGGIRSAHGGDVWIHRDHASLGTISGVNVHWYDGDPPDAPSVAP
jgi:hypothetical protein